MNLYPTMLVLSSNTTCGARNFCRVICHRASLHWTVPSVQNWQRFHFATCCIPVCGMTWLELQWWHPQTPCNAWHLTPLGSVISVRFKTTIFLIFRLAQVALKHLNSRLWTRAVVGAWFRLGLQDHLVQRIRCGMASYHSEIILRIVWCDALDDNSEFFEQMLLGAKNGNGDQRTYNILAGSMLASQICLTSTQNSWQSWRQLVSITTPSE